MRFYLVVLSVALVVPLLIASILLTLNFARSEMQSGRDELVRDATSLSADIDREVSGLLTVLELMATSTSLSTGDLSAFHTRAAAALGPRNAYVILLDTNLQQLLNTRRPFGAQLPMTSDRESARIVLQTRDIRISDSFIGAVSGQRVINLLRPVIENGQVRYILILTVDASRFDPILQAGSRRAAYALLLLDSKDQLVAAALPAHRSPPDLAVPPAAAPRQDVSARSIAGETWLEATRRSQLTGWRTVVRVPQAVLDGPVWRSLYLLGLATLATIGAAVAVIVAVTRRMSSSIAAILDATRRLAAGEPLPATSSALLEAVEIAGGLGEAGRLIEARTSRLRESEARYRAALRLGKMGSWETDFARRTRRWSPEAVSLFDLRRSDGVVGGEDDELAAAMHPDDRHLLARYHQHIQTHDELEAEYRIVLRDGSVRHVAGRGLVTSRQPDGTPRTLTSVVADVTERSEAEEHLADIAMSLANAKARFEALVAAAAQIVWSATPSGAVIEDSPSWRAFTGQTEAQFMGSGWLDAVHPEDRERTRQAWLEAVQKRQPYQVDYRLRHVSDGYRWTRARGVPLTRAQDVVVEWVGMNEDIHDEVTQNEQLRIVSRELSHRTKNLLAVIQSIARRSFAQDQGASPRLRPFLDRLQGLAVSHDLLVHGNWSGVSLAELVREHLKPFLGADDGALEIDGPSLNVAPGAAQTLGLALHELATNAAKYGALKAAGGKLRIAWSRAHGEHGETLDFRWREEFASASGARSKSGFGSQILDRIVGDSLGGTTTYCLSDGAIEWHLVAPLDRVSAAH